MNAQTQSHPSRPARIARSLLGFAVAWVFAGAFYLLLIDITQLPELLVGAGAVTLAAVGTELARAHEVVGEGFRLPWLLRLYRPLLQVPKDVAFVSVAAVRQLFEREKRRGEFRAVRFTCGENPHLESGRHSLTEAAGSFAPNTIIVGIDTERELLLAHQLRRSGGREALDTLELG